MCVMGRYYLYFAYRHTTQDSQTSKHQSSWWGGMIYTSPTGTPLKTSNPLSTNIHDGKVWQIYRRLGVLICIGCVCVCWCNISDLIWYILHVIYIMHYIQCILLPIYTLYIMQHDIISIFISYLSYLCYIILYYYMTFMFASAILL